MIVSATSASSPNAVRRFTAVEALRAGCPTSIVELGRPTEGHGEPPNEAGTQGNPDMPGKTDGKKTEDQAPVIPPPKVLMQDGEEQDESDDDPFHRDFSSRGRRSVLKKQGPNPEER